MFEHVFENVNCSRRVASHIQHTLRLCSPLPERGRSPAARNSIGIVPAEPQTPASIESAPMTTTTTR
jgi:hypothetical protein